MLGFDVGAARKVWTASLLALLFFVIYVASTTVLVIVFAVFFSYLIYPMVALVERVRPRRVPRVMSIAVVFVVVVALLAVVGSLFGVELQDQATHLFTQLPGLLRTDVPNRFPLPHFLEPLRERIVDFVRSQIETGSDKAVPLARSLGLGVVHAASNLIYLVLIPILSFLLIKDGERMRDAFLALLNRRHRVLWSEIVDDVNVLLSKYVRALLFLSLATLFCYGVAFSLLGVPYAFLLAVSAGLLEFVPFAGPLAAVAITLVVAVFSGYPHLLWLVIFIGLYRLFQDYVLNPYLMSEGVEVSPFLVIVGLLAGDQLGGVAGIFLAVPVIATLKIVIGRARVFYAASHEQGEAARRALTGSTDDEM
ncbi:putative PurR-regulated permease PerM [Paraburkholderia atlantica]|uniref:Putative PurR-regulated permease PerM n=1 Tax=Paraburkholderia atlantica TaxID=2654982 RepID=A0A7W8V436_PARAM|nr:AI-2E family transporter [Paraburkholderia atlantica]MBB5422213.1 putative PurR-regulated permease PerM [Paraburkholderia atlantica]